MTNKLFEKFFRKNYKEPVKWEISPEDKFLILAPHPDDDTVGCGGLLALYPHQCDVICLTDGRYGDQGISPEELIEIRKNEFENVMRNTGVNSFQMLGIEDSKLDEAKPVLELEKYTRILIPSPEDLHPDHRAVSYLLKKYYGKHYKKVVYYELISLLSNPTHILDISPVIYKKQENMGCYHSQMKFINYIDRISALNRYRGTFFYFDFAEAYQFAQE
ncbi:MAG: PIG-L family deacetylase [Candidatus Gastranaerophilales bacterium]|nr:PIG-L family deacetylase [Candidatus Gastranaerophilales bacterium]